MAKPELSKQHKGISSGRLISSARVPVRKKKVSGRQLPAADPRYSLYSSDSEDQVTTIHKGLDRCAALLNGFLQTENTDTKPSRLGKSVPPKPTQKFTAGKGEKKKKRPTKKTSSNIQIPAVIQKTDSSSQTIPGFLEHQSFPSGQNSVRQPFLAWEVQPPPEASPATCGHVNPQMVLPTNQKPTNYILPPPPEPQNYTSTVFNSRLTTSTPTLTPHKSSNSVYSELPQQSLAPGGLVPSDCAPQTAWAALLPFHVPHAQPQPAVTVPHVEQQPSSQTPAPWSDGGSEYSKRSTAEDRTESADMTLVNDTPVKDTSCQTSFEKCVVHPEAENTSPGKTAKKIMTLKNLLGDLKAIVAGQEDGVALRLVTEVEQNVCTLPAVVGNTSIQAEIALSLQPLRSENAQLRRRLRIVNQQLMERERAEKEARPVDCNLELISLQSMNVSLHSQLKETQREMQALQRENQELQQKNSQLQQALRDKDWELQQSRKQCELVTSCIKRDLDDTILEMKSSQSTPEEPEKENACLNVGLQPRASGASRLQQLTRDMSRVASELPLLKNDTTKPSLHLTTALDQYEGPEKEGPPHDPVPDSIKKYLKMLESSGLTSSPGDIQCISENTAPQPDWSKIQSSKLPEEKPCSPKSRPAMSASEKGLGLSLDEDPELKKTTYVPLKETMKKQPLGDIERPSPVGSLNGVKSSEERNEIQDEIKGSVSKGLTQTFKRMHVSKLPFDHMPVIDDLIGDIPTTVFSMTYPSSSQNVVPPHNPQLLLPSENGKMLGGRLSGLDSTLSSCDIKSVASDWSLSTWSTFNTWDEQDFRKGLAALDASIASLQKTLQSDLKR
ncbi:coiled-coil domain-containing protein 14 [Megalops cyprinoides]|uniref:coiled-coil domain-containing protein 14 n=1 Tax=Megalops cyprinoides TaxID=118141 RepID=UPI001864D16D|nr:coiled-coil domain-containing protein 14 [Megalops cyprinoides]